MGERDEQQAVFRRLQEEAAHIADQPEVPDQLTTLQERWDYVCTASDEINLELEKVQRLELCSSGTVLY